MPNTGEQGWRHGVDWGGHVHPTFFRSAFIPKQKRYKKTLGIPSGNQFYRLSTPLSQSWRRPCRRTGQGKSIRYFIFPVLKKRTENEGETGLKIGNFFEQSFMGMRQGTESRK